MKNLTFCSWWIGLKYEKFDISKIKCTNVFHPNLKFTYEYSTDRINFLDVIVKKEKDKFVTDLYCKATDCHQYLHYDSCFPDHLKKLSIYGQGLRIKCLCSDGHKLQKHLEILKNWFCDRGYPGGLVGEQLQRVKGKSRVELWRPKAMDKKSVEAPSMVTYHPHLKKWVR